MSGTFPPDPVTSPVAAADSTPAEPAEQVEAKPNASEVKPPASESGAKRKTSDPEKDERYHELLADRARYRADNERLQQQIDALMAGKPTKSDAAAESSPAVDVESVITSPDVSNPELSEADFFAQFPDASYGQYARYIARYAVMSDRASAKVLTDKERRQQAYDNALKTDPAFSKDALHEKLRDLPSMDELPPGQAPTMLNLLMQEVRVSPDAPKLLKHLSAHPEIVERIAGLTNVGDLFRAMGRLDAELELASASEKKPAPPAPKPTSAAPPPPITLGTKPAVPADDVESAVAEGNFSRYEAAANRRDLAASRR